MENQKGWFEALRPKKSSDFFAFVVMIVLLWVIMLFELLIVLPIYHAPLSGWYCIHVFCGFFMWMNVFANFYMMIMIDTTGKNLGMPSVLKPGWTYCPFCQLNSPPRAHHCQVCNECVLKRDHHCIFAGKCLGELSKSPSQLRVRVKSESESLSDRVSCFLNSTKFRFSTLPFRFEQFES